MGKIGWKGPQGRRFACFLGQTMINDTIPAQERAFGGGQTSPADLRPRRGKGVSGPRSTAGGERGPWIGPDMRKRMNRDMEINGEIVNDKVRYADLNLSPELMRAIDKKGYVQATPVQAGAIPYFMEWKDVIAKAPTGTGKTLPSASLWSSTPIPRDPGHRPGAGPTRELAIQIRTSCGTCARSRRGCAPCVSTAGSPSTNRSSS